MTSPDEPTADGVRDALRRIEDSKARTAAEQARADFERSPQGAAEKRAREQRRLEDQFELYRPMLSLASMFHDCVTRQGCETPRLYGRGLFSRLPKRAWVLLRFWQDGATQGVLRGDNVSFSNVRPVIWLLSEDGKSLVIDAQSTSGEASLKKRPPSLRAGKCLPLSPRTVHNLGRTTNLGLVQHNVAQYVRELGITWP